MTLGQPPQIAMKQMPSGAKGSFRFLVQPDQLANRFKDAILPSVLARRP